MIAEASHCPAWLLPSVIGQGRCRNGNRSRSHSSSPCVAGFLDAMVALKEATSDSNNLQILRICKVTNPSRVRSFTALHNSCVPFLFRVRANLLTSLAATLKVLRVRMLGIIGWRSEKIDNLQQAGAGVSSHSLLYTIHHYFANTQDFYLAFLEFVGIFQRAHLREILGFS